MPSSNGCSIKRIEKVIDQDEEMKSLFWDMTRTPLTHRLFMDIVYTLYGIGLARASPNDVFSGKLALVAFKPYCTRQQYDVFWSLLDAPTETLKLYSPGKYVKAIAEALGTTNRLLLVGIPQMMMNGDDHQIAGGRDTQ
jgi:hypothetical protein